MRKYKIIYKSLLVIMWLSIIFLFSNQNGQISTNLTNNILDKVLWFINNDAAFMIIRKLAHLTEYFILGILVYNLLIEFSSQKILTCSYLICLICSCMDEIHQLFISGRSANIFDVLIDFVGSILGILLMRAFIHKNLSLR